MKLNILGSLPESASGRFTFDVTDFQKTIRLTIVALLGAAYLNEWPHIQHFVSIADIKMAFDPQIYINAMTIPIGDAIRRFLSDQSAPAALVGSTSAPAALVTVDKAASTDAGQTVKLDPRTAGGDRPLLVEGVSMRPGQIYQAIINDAPNVKWPKIVNDPVGGVVIGPDGIAKSVETTVKLPTTAEPEKK